MKDRDVRTSNSATLSRDVHARFLVIHRECRACVTIFAGVDLWLGRHVMFFSRPEIRQDLM